MKIFKQFLAIILTTFLILNNALADESKQVEIFIQNLGDNIIDIASDKNTTLEVKKDKITKSIEAIVDSKWIARFVLAKHYRSATKAQRERFENLYRDFMINSYAPSFNGYNGEKFKILGTITQGKYFLTKCLFIPKEGPQIDISFRLKKNKNTGEFNLLDVIAQGVSLIETQRSEFGSVISNKGLDAFLNDLEERLKELKKPSTLRLK